MDINISSTDINLLILHYLRERGLNTTAFSLEKEAKVSDVPLTPGLLISHLQRSLILEELESHSIEPEITPKCKSIFELTQKHECEYEEPPKLEEAISMIIEDNYENI